MLFLRLRVRLLGSVLLCFRRPRASCRCRLLWALFVFSRFVLLVRARGPALRLEVCLLGFPAVVCGVTPLPTTASLCYRSEEKRIHTSC